MSRVVFAPRQMTAQELQDGRRAVYRDFYSIQSIIYRTLTRRGKFILRLLVNLSYRFINRGRGMCKGRGRLSIEIGLFSPALSFA